MNYYTNMIDWHTIDTVLFDMDGTLLDLHFDNYFWLTHLPKRYAEAKGISEEDARHFLNGHITALEGSLQWYCLDHWSELVDMDIPTLKEEIRHKIQIRPHTEQFLDELKQLGKHLVLVTNAHPKGMHLKFKHTSVDHWMDEVVSSHEYLSPKEEQRFWFSLKDQVEFNPKRTLFLDDTPRILRSARDFGIEHLVCINQPDSQKPAQESDEFIDISHFDEIMPSSTPR